MCGKTEKWLASKKQTRDRYRTCEHGFRQLFCYLFMECPSSLFLILIFNKTKRKEKHPKE